MGDGRRCALFEFLLAARLPINAVKLPPPFFQANFDLLNPSAINPMAEIIKMPKMSDTMTEGTIAAWLKKVGDKVKSGDILAEVETDKATMELENYEDGTLLYIGPKTGEAVPVDGILAIVGKEGEDFAALLNGSTGGAAAAPEAPQPPAPKEAPAAPVPTPTLAPVAAATPAAPASAPTLAPVAAATPATPATPANGKKATVVRMPKMSDTMTEGTIAAWLKKVGDKVKSGDILAEVETDKATMELENYEDGTLLYTGPKAGEAVSVDGILAIIGEEGADIQALLVARAAVPLPFLPRLFPPLLSPPRLRSRLKRLLQLSRPLLRLWPLRLLFRLSRPLLQLRLMLRPLRLLRPPVGAFWPRH